MIAGKGLMHHCLLLMMMRSAVIDFAPSYQSTWEKKVSMVHPSYDGFLANAVGRGRSEVRAGSVVTNCASLSSGYAPTSPSLHSNCPFFELQ